MNSCVKLHNFQGQKQEINEIINKYASKTVTETSLLANSQLGR